MIPSNTNTVEVRITATIAPFLLVAITIAAAVTSYPARAATADADFAARCAGALVCEGFDNASTFVSSTGSEGLHPSLDNGRIGGFQDTSIKASGTSALRFDIPANAPSSDVAGQFTKNFSRTFSQNSTFYVQWQQRFDSNMATFNWGGASWKQAIMFDQNGSTCANIELTTVNYNGGGFPILYSECGNRAAWTDSTDISHWVPAAGGVLLEQGTTTSNGYNCQDGRESPGSGNGVGCFKYPVDTWVTFYYEIHVGTWGSANSTLRAFVAVNGGPYREWVNVRDYTLGNDGNAAGGWSSIMLTPYMTGRNGSTSPASHTWYDELIISTLPIAAPGGLPAPGNMRVQ